MVGINTFEIKDCKEMREGEEWRREKEEGEMIRNLETTYVSSKTNSRWVNNERDIPPIIKLTLPLDLRFLPLSSVFTFLSLLSYLSRKIQKAQFDHLQLFENNARKQMDSWGFMMFRLNQIYKNCKIERDRKIEIGYIYKMAVRIEAEGPSIAW